MTIDRAGDDASPCAGRDTGAMENAPAAAPSATENLRPLTLMWSQVAADALVLVRTEAKLARDEVSGNLKSYVRATVIMVAGLGLMFLAGIFLIVAAIVALAGLIGMLWALLAVGIGCIIIGIVAALSAKSAFARLSVLPRQSLHRISDDVGRMAQSAEDARTAAKDMSSNG